MNRGPVEAVVATTGPRSRPLWMWISHHTFRRRAEKVIGCVLNHAAYNITARHYNQHPYRDEMLRAVEGWDRALADILAGKEAKKSRRVVQFRR